MRVRVEVERLRELIMSSNFKWIDLFMESTTSNGDRCCNALGSLQLPYNQIKGGARMYALKMYVPVGW